MPLYEYECETCGVRFEVIQRFADASVDTCKACGGHVQRLFSAPAIQFKGTGWYITDYARKGKTDGDSSPAPSPTTPSSPASSPDGSSSSTSSDKPSGGSGSSSAASTPSTPSAPSTSSSAGGDKK